MHLVSNARAAIRLAAAVFASTIVAAGTASAQEPIRIRI